jgi:hypothetical protein
VSAAMAGEFVTAATEMAGQILTLGPNPLRSDNAPTMEEEA